MVFQLLLQQFCELLGKKSSVPLGYVGFLSPFSIRGNLWNRLCDSRHSWHILLDRCKRSQDVPSIDHSVHKHALSCNLPDDVQIVGTHLKHLKGCGIYNCTGHSSNPTLISAGGFGKLNVSTAVFSLIISPFSLIVIILASETPCLFNCVFSSSFVVFFYFLGSNDTL